MEAERPKSEPTRDEPSAEERTAPEVKLGASPLRCPYCHASVLPDRETVCVCGGCLARHHASCWREHGVCASCSSPEGLVPMKTVAQLLPVATRGGGSPGLGLALACVLLLVVLAASQAWHRSRERELENAVLDLSGRVEREQRSAADAGRRVTGEGGLKRDIDALELQRKRVEDELAMEKAAHAELDKAQAQGADRRERLTGFLLSENEALGLVEREVRKREGSARGPDEDVAKDARAYEDLAVTTLVQGKADDRASRTNAIQNLLIARRRYSVVQDTRSFQRVERALWHLARGETFELVLKALDGS